MDEIDRSILLQLQENGRMLMMELGKKVGLSTTAVNERVKKPEDKEVITGYRAIIDPKKMNKHVIA